MPLIETGTDIEQTNKIKTLEKEVNTLKETINKLLDVVKVLDDDKRTKPKKETDGPNNDNGIVLKGDIYNIRVSNVNIEKIETLNIKLVNENEECGIVPKINIKDNDVE